MKTENVKKKRRTPRYRTREGRTLIEISLKSSQQLIDVRDPAPFYDKDLDDDAAKYILGAAQEHSIKTPLGILIHLKELSQSQTDEEKSVHEAISNYFFNEGALAHKNLRNTLKTGRMFLLIGFVTLTLCLFLADAMDKHILQNHDWTLLHILKEGLVISGWVALWRPIELFLYDWWPMRERRQLYQKLSKTPVYVQTSLTAPTNPSKT